VLDALATASAATGVATGLLLAADRTLPPAEAEGQARLAARHAGSAAGTGSAAGVVAFGLHHDETLGRPEPFAAAFRIARDAGLSSAPHAGELAGPDSVWGTLDALAPDRIQHGVRSVEDARLLDRLAADQVCLDVCPTSNVMLGVVPSLDEHPLPALLAAGVPCSLNGDDPLLFGPGLLAEYETARGVLGLDDRALATIAATSLSAAALDSAARASALAAVERWLAPEAA
jgi:adenosine deaminase